MYRRDFLKAAALGLVFRGRWPSVHNTKSAPATPFPVYLTFDDGPTTLPDRTGPTTRVLDILKAEQVPATFFLHGRAIQTWSGPVIVRMIREGHAVANHLWRQGGNTVADASPLPLLAQQYIIAEESIRSALRKTDLTAFLLYLAQPKLFRRPGGNNGLTGFLDPKNYEVLLGAPYLKPYRAEMDLLKVVYDYSGWHVNGGDGITNPKIQPDTPQKMVQWILKGGYGYYGVDAYLCAGSPPQRSHEAKDGLIVLLHDADPVTDEALTTIIRELRNRGADFHALPRPQDQPNTKTVGIGYPATPDPYGVVCADQATG